MAPLTPRTVVYLAFNVALLAVCLLHLPHLIRRPGVPFEADTRNGGVVVIRILAPAAAGSLGIGDRIIRWNDDSILVARDLEFLADFQTVGERVTMTLEDGRTAAISLPAFHDLRYVLIVLLVGAVTWSVGVFVLLARPGELAARVLHGSLVCMGASTILAWGQTAEGSVVALLSRGIFLLVYVGVPSSFYFFTTLFPRPAKQPVSRNALLAFVPASIVLVILLATQLEGLALHSLPANRSFRRWYDLFQIMKLLYVGAGIVTIVRAYTHAQTSAERKKLQWIMWGLAIGPAPFLLLITIPELFLPSGLVPEELTLIFLMIIPIAFAISFVKYRVLDIEVVIKRTTVYGLVLAGSFAGYVLLVLGATTFVSTAVPAVSGAAAVMIALVFEPVRRRVQRVVDRRFFRVTYDFREAGKRFLADIERALDEDQLGALVVRRTAEVIPVERQAILLLPDSGMRPRLLAHADFASLDGREIPAAGMKPDTPLRRPIALEGSIEHGEDAQIADPRAFLPLGIAVIFPIVGEAESLRGMYVLGPKKSGARFSAEDVALLTQVAAETGLALERIVLHRRLLLQQAEGRRLEELNRLKSDFVSYVSHELRTPLTSIKMFTDLLQSPSMRLGRKARAHLRIIDGEAERLGRMVNTILDSARIEQGVKEYRPVVTDVIPIVRRAMSAMDFQLSQSKFTTRVTLPRRPVPVFADPDAVAQAIMNVIANAIKYSADQKYLAVRVACREHRVRISVTDRGRGIPPESLPHLFERFYRDPSVSTNIQGVGLGLPLVRNIMEGCQGSVEVTSIPGKGSTFTLVFPFPPEGSGFPSHRKETQA